MDSFLQNVFIIHNKKFYTIDSQLKDEGWAFSMELMLDCQGWKCLCDDEMQTLHA